VQESRRILVHNISKTPLDKQVFTKLIRHYYKGPYNITIKFDSRISGYGEHTFNTKRKIHIIRISPKICRLGRGDTRWYFNSMETQSKLVRMNKYDTICRIIQVLLHELKHAEQCDRDIKQYWKANTNLHESIIQPRLKYELSPFEAEAEGWSLINFNKALERYENWSQ
jgi:hypothetical protein